MRCTLDLYFRKTMQLQSQGWVTDTKGGLYVTIVQVRALHEQMHSVFNT